jgi:hypothetical protein
MNEDSASGIARESFDKTLETGAETARGVQEGFTSALENVRDLNVRLIAMGGRTPTLLSTLRTRLQKPKRRRIWFTRGRRTRPNSLTC